MNTPANTPRITVIIPTYNWSSVLRCSIQSVLWQTFTDWELWVVGDGCTDDSEAVTLSFGDPRIHWYNLPENTGSQYGPNNKGLEFAQGEYVAYLGHDDVWYFNHLEALLTAIEEQQADLAYTICKLIQPEASLKLVLRGLTPSHAYESLLIIPPTSLMHRRDMVEKTGGWRSAREIRLSTDIDFSLRAWTSGCKLIPVNALTCFKFPATERRNVYQYRPSHEQTRYLDRMQSEPDFLYRELLEVVSDPIHIERTFQQKQRLESMEGPAEISNRWRVNRGLEALSASERAPAVHQDLSALIAINRRDDISPLLSRLYLHEHGRLPENGLLIGANWHPLERDEWGRAFRWVNNDAELIVTHPRPAGVSRRLALHVFPGPGAETRPIILNLVDGDGQTVAEAQFDGEATVAFTFTPEAEIGVYTLQTTRGAQEHTASERILNFGVYAFSWDDSPVEALRAENAWLYEVKQQYELALNQPGANQAALSQAVEALRAENAWLYEVKQQYELALNQPGAN